MNEFKVRLFQAWLIIVLFSVCPIISFAQTRKTVTVFDARLNSQVSGVKIYNTKGMLLGITNDLGKATIFIKGFPIFFEKKGYITLSVYDTLNLNHISLQSFGKKIKTIEIVGKLDIKKYLLHLRNKNYPHFVHRDTTVYYKFSYSLSFPDKDWQEKAWGYLKINRAQFKKSTVIDTSFYNYLSNPADFVQFHYKNSGNGFVKSKEFKKACPMPLIIILYNDCMSTSGYMLWHKLTHHYTFMDKISPFAGAKIYGHRKWTFHLNKEKDKCFSAEDQRHPERLKEKIIFDSIERLCSVTLYQPDFFLTFLGVRFIDNYSSKNDINSFRTVYTYTTNDKNRLLSGIDHLSTFYKKGKMYYKMSFKMSICKFPPKILCNIPIGDMTGIKKKQDLHGYGVWQLVKKDAKKNH